MIFQDFIWPVWQFCFLQNDWGIKVNIQTANFTVLYRTTYVANLHRKHRKKVNADYELLEQANSQYVLTSRAKYFPVRPSHSVNKDILFQNMPLPHGCISLGWKRSRKSESKQRPIMSDSAYSHRISLSDPPKHRLCWLSSTETNMLKPRASK